MCSFVQQQLRACGNVSQFAGALSEEVQERFIVLLNWPPGSGIEASFLERIVPASPIEAFPLMREDS
jgi:hypothetical protein